MTLELVPDLMLLNVKRDSLRTGNVASACGVSVDTIRHYERKGVISPASRDENGYRRYPPETVRRVLVIRKALGIGFTLDELSRFFRQRAAGRPPCREVRDLAERKLAELDARIAESLKLRASLAGTLESWDQKMRGSNGAMAYLLDSLIQD